MWKSISEEVRDLEELVQRLECTNEELQTKVGKFEIDLGAADNLIIELESYLDEIVPYLVESGVAIRFEDAVEYVKRKVDRNVRKIGG